MMDDSLTMPQFTRPEVSLADYNDLGPYDAHARGSSASPSSVPIASTSKQQSLFSYLVRPEKGEPADCYRYVT